MSIWEIRFKTSKATVSRNFPVINNIIDIAYFYNSSYWLSRKVWNRPKGIKNPLYALAVALEIIFQSWTDKTQIEDQIKMCFYNNTVV